MRRNVRGFIWMVLPLALAASCSGPSQQEINEANRLAARARDQEERFETLDAAIEQYHAVAEKYASVEAGKKAAERARTLAEARPFISRMDSVEVDSLLSFYERFNRTVPDYPPVVRKLGRLYYDRTYLLGRTAAKTEIESFTNTTLKLWARQDSMWSTYSFRPTAGDRQWRDRLCRQALDVSRMLQELDRYEEAMEVVNRGISYAASDDAVAEARVFASYYAFTLGDNRKAVELANQALENEHLSDSDRARAQHVIGLAYTYIYEESGELPDLDAAIAALNESVNLDPGLSEPKELLKALRSARGKMPL